MRTRPSCRSCFNEAVGYYRRNPQEVVLADRAPFGLASMRPSGITDGILRTTPGAATDFATIASMRPSGITDGIGQEGTLAGSSLGRRLQ